jgi:hypothetical protein
LDNTPSNEGMDASYQALKNVITNPEFQKALAEIQSLPPIERLQAAYTQLTAQALAARGITIPAQFSITTNTSEKSTNSTISAEAIAAPEQSAATRPLLQADTIACVGIPPYRVCFHINLI